MNMSMLMTISIRSVACATLLGAFIQLASAAQSPAAAEQEREALKIIQSDAPAGDKALACKRLAIYGGKSAVPALAPMLLEERYSSWARTALEDITDPSATDVLREALGKTQGRVLSGVINSVGVKRDAKAVPALAAKLKDADTQVAEAAASALGRIGGSGAVSALTGAMGSAPEAVRSEAAYGLVRCAEQLMEAGKAGDAVRLYDSIRKAKLPKQRIAEATRGAILARQGKGIALLQEQLRSEDKALFAVGLRVTRELPGREATMALANELEKLAPDRQPLLLVALADRGDAAALPAIEKTARTGIPKARMAAFAALERFNQLGSIPVLLEGAADSDKAVAQAAKLALAKLTVAGADAELVARISKASGKTKQALVEVAGQRRIASALPAVVALANDPDAGVRNAVVTTLGSIGEAQQAGDLAQLLAKAPGEQERGDLERALLAICSRLGTACLPHVLPLAKNADAEVRKIALHTLASVGGTEALSAVKAAMDDQNEGVQDEAVRTLSTWSNTWPEDAGVAEPLLALAKSAKKPAHQVLGVRGFLQFVEGDAKLGDAKRVAYLNEVLPMLQRPEEKRLAVSVAGGIPNGAAIEWLLARLEDEAVAQDVCLALGSLAAKGDLKDAPKELREKALRTVLEKSKDDRAKKRAEAALKKLN